MKKVIVMLAVVVMALLAACGGDDLYVDQAFVGTWHMVDNVQWTFEFHADGSGQAGDLQIQEFSWGTRDGLLVLEHGRGIIDDEFTYTLDGNMLNLVDDTINRDYIRPDPDQNLIGSWVIIDVGWAGYISFSSDGTGYELLLFDDPAQRDDFNWFNAGDLLIQHLGPLQQAMWTYSVSGDNLNLVSRQVTGLTLDLSRGSFSQNTELLGQWAWQDDNDWLYYFGANGEGTSGWTDDPISWATFEDTLIVHDGSFFEIWRFTIAGDVMHLESLDVPGLDFSYVRVR